MSIDADRRAVIRKALEDPVASIVVGWLPGENEAVVLQPAELIALLDMADAVEPGGENRG